MLYIFFTFVAYTFSTAAAESVCEDVYPHLLLSSSQNEGVCISTGGCWDASKDVCYFPRVNGYEYTEIYKDDYELVGQLKLIESSGATVSPDFTDLSIIIQQETKKRTHIRIYPTDTDRWQIPQSVIPRPSDMVYDGSEGTADTNVFIESSAPLQFGIRRGSQLIFFMSKMLIFQDQYVQFVLASPSNVQQSYGFGESSRKVSFIEPDTLYTMWNTDNFDSNFNSSLYGSHPFYIQVLDDGSAFGVMSMTCNAQTASMYNSDTNGDSVAFQSTGGIVDLYIFAGPSPSDVIAQYHTLIGRPMIPPYFSLGFHNSRWGYPDIQYVEEVVH